MKPVPTRDATHNFQKPDKWGTEPGDGACGELSVRAQRYNGGARMEFVSTWQPSPDELEMLKAGGVAILSIIGVQPPVAISVEPYPFKVADTSAAPALDEDSLDREGVQTC
jgi:hypothetical protein